MSREPVSHQRHERATLACVWRDPLAGVFCRLESQKRLNPTVQGVSKNSGGWTGIMIPHHGSSLFTRTRILAHPRRFRSSYSTCCTRDKPEQSWLILSSNVDGTEQLVTGGIDNFKEVGLSHDQRGKCTAHIGRHRKSVKDNNSNSHQVSSEARLPMYCQGLSVAKACEEIHPASEQRTSVPVISAT